MISLKKQQVACRKLSKELRELGYSQSKKNSIWYWYRPAKGTKWKVGDSNLSYLGYGERYSAPTLPELLEKIPSPLSIGGTEIYFSMGKDKDRFHCGYCFDDGTWAYWENSIWEGDKEYELYIADVKRLVDGVARILIYLLQHKLIKVGEK